MSFTPGPDGFGIFECANPAQPAWSRVPGGAMRVALDPRPGVFSLCVVNRSGEIWYSEKGDGSDFKKLPGSGVDVAIGSDGRVVVIGTDPA